MRICTIFLILFIQTSLFAQINPDHIKEHHQQEAARKAAALDKARNSDTELVAEPGRGYDVSYYGLMLDIYPAQYQMNGMVKVQGIVTQSTLSNLWLDFKSYMTVDSIIGQKADGFLEYTHDNGQLVITLEREYATDEEFNISIFYHGRTDFGGQSVFGVSFGHTDVFGRDHIWSLSEPYGARDWWPCKDTPLDKADSMDINYIVPNGMSAVGNGKLISKITADSRTSFHWKVNYPIATYLVSIAAYDYQLYEDTYISQSADTLPIMFYVAPENYSGSRQNFALVSPMIAAYADMFGEYPFMDEKYGHAEASISGGMEHQTITTLGPIQFSGGAYGEDLIAHELAHQWWGDMITCASFHDIWLNEGFATYAEALVAEYMYGKSLYKSIMATNAYKGSGTIYVDDTTSSGRIFDSNLSYAKAGYVLHMLRGVVGDEVFFNIMKTWYDNAKTKYKAAYTEDFQQVCEQVSGLDLEKFFQQWIYGEFFPQYAYGFKTEQSDTGYAVTLILKQIQDNTDLFRMPVEVRIYTATDTVNFVVQDSLASQEFTLLVKNEPLYLVIDPDNWILKEIRPLLIDPPLNKGILLVNGMGWSRAGVMEAYEDRAFWGTAPIAFWDISGEPSEGYPQTLPPALGQGELPPQTLAAYSTVIWVSSRTPDDRDNWHNLPIMDYLEAGGNIIFISQSASGFFTNSQLDYLGINWNEQDNILIRDFNSSYNGLSDMDLSANMAFISTFDTTLTKASSTLLFKSREGYDQSKGVGVFSDPDQGGNFVYLAARPWMLDHQQLKSNMLYMLQNFMQESSVSVGITDDTMPVHTFAIKSIYPNPFNPATVIAYSVGRYGNKPQPVTLKIYDVLGRQVATLVDKKQTAGTYTIEWNAANLSSGIYFIQLQSPKDLYTSKAILMK